MLRILPARPSASIVIMSLLHLLLWFPSSLRSSLFYILCQIYLCTIRIRIRTLPLSAQSSWSDFLEDTYFVVVPWIWSTICEVNSTFNKHTYINTKYQNIFNPEVSADWLHSARLDSDCLWLLCGELSCPQSLEKFEPFTQIIELQQQNGVKIKVSEKEENYVSQASGEFFIIVVEIFLHREDLHCAAKNPGCKLMQRVALSVKWLPGQEYVEIPRTRAAKWVNTPVIT